MKVPKDLTAVVIGYAIATAILGVIGPLFSPAVFGELTGARLSCVGGFGVLFWFLHRGHNWARLILYFSFAIMLVGSLIFPRPGILHIVELLYFGLLPVYLVLNPTKRHFNKRASKD